MNHSITYSIIVHNEGERYLKNLFTSIFEVIEPQDEISVVDDFSTEESTVKYLEELKTRGVKFIQHKFGGDFSEHKNFAISQCTKEVIFNIDADEFFSPDQFRKIRERIEENYDNFDIIYLSRINTLDHVTEEYVNNQNPKMGIVLLNGEYKIMLGYPDFQGRIFKNNGKIKWTRKVHEILGGWRKPMKLEGKDYSIIHEKTITRQFDQLKFYDGILKNA